MGLSQSLVRREPIDHAASRSTARCRGGAEAPEASEAIGPDEIDELEVDGMVPTAAILLDDAGTS